MASILSQRSYDSVPFARILSLLEKYGTMSLAQVFQPALEWHASNPVLSRYMLAAFMRDTAYMQADRLSQHLIYERLMREQIVAQLNAGALDLVTQVNGEKKFVAAALSSIRDRSHLDKVCVSH